MSSKHFSTRTHTGLSDTDMKSGYLSTRIGRLIVPFYSWFALIILLLIPFMLWDLLVLGLPSEGGLARKSFAPSSLELMVMAITWITATVKPAWDNHIKDFLDNVGRALLIYEAYKWVQSKWIRKKENK